MEALPIGAPEEPLAGAWEALAEELQELRRKEGHCGTAEHEPGQCQIQERPNKAGEGPPVDHVARHLPRSLHLEISHFKNIKNRRNKQVELIEEAALREAAEPVSS